jgi:hypothetical protein
MEVHVLGGIVYAVETESMPDIGRREVKGIWRAPCGARLRYPAGTQTVKFGEDYFEMTPEEERARDEADAKLLRGFGIQ